jgi:cell wall-associated NlpC family hydrolase
VGTSPRRPWPAGPVALHVAAGTAVDAVTAGKIKVIAAGHPASRIILSGTDGATYTYRGVAATLATGTKVKAGTRVGVSGPAGFTFSILVPDVRGAVDADEALQAWAAGVSVNVRALPSTIMPVRAAHGRQKVLIITDKGAAAAARDLARALAGRTIKVKDVTVSGTRRLTGHRLLGQIRRAGQQLVIVALAQGKPAQAAALTRRVPAGHRVLWVAPPGITAKQAAAYRAIVVAHRRFRVESLPAALAAVISPDRPARASSAGSRPATGAQATATLVAAYAATAYRLEPVRAQALAVVSWAEQQLGKPYRWGAAGPGSFDCSGLTMEALAQAGIAVSHNANAQWQKTRSHAVAQSQLAPGDLVFYTGSDGSPTAPGHVGIYFGNGEIIDAPHTGAAVRFDALASIGGYVGAADPFPATPAVNPFAATTPAIHAGGIVAAPAAANQYENFAHTLADATWGSTQFAYLNLLWQQESGWNPAATNPRSGAFGIPQALPAAKMASAGLDWATNPYTQIIWGIGYVKATYQTPQAAWAHELAYGWY